MAMRSSITYPAKKRRKNGSITVVGGDKGGVGKSFVARALAAWYRRRGYLVHGFDGDARNGHLERYYGNSFTVDRLSLRDEYGWALLFEGWQDAPHDAVLLVDLPGNIGGEVERERERVGLMAEAFDRELIHVWVADEEEDSVTLFERLCGVAPWQQTLVVLNGRFGANINAFELWRDSDIRAELLDHGGYETLLPTLPIGVRTRITRTHCSFDDLTLAALATYQKVDFDMWWASVERAFTALDDIMEKVS